MRISDWSSDVGSSDLRHDGMPTRLPMPATDGSTIWLPNTAQSPDHGLAMEHFRVMALLQAMRAQRGSANLIAGISSPRVRALYLILEAQACDETLAALLPGVAARDRKSTRLNSSH